MRWAKYYGTNEWRAAGVIECRPRILGKMQERGVGLNTDNSDRDQRPSGWLRTAFA
jgi:hypothetical protein